MKVILFISLLILTSNVLILSQDFCGKYYNNDLYLILNPDSTAKFKVEYGCCLLSHIWGSGKYHVENEKVIIQTEKPKEGTQSSYEIINNLTDSNSIEVIVNPENPVVGCNLVVNNENDKTLSGDCCDFNEKGIIKNLNFTNIDNCTLKIAFIGYDSFEIPLSEILGKAIKVDLVQYTVLENEKVYFEIQRDSISSKIVGPYFYQTKSKFKKRTFDSTKRVFRTWPWNWWKKSIHGEPTRTEFRI